MSLYDYVSELVINTKGSTEGGLFTWPTSDSSLGLFLPELTICATIVVILLLRMFSWGRRIDTFWPAVIGAALALSLAAPWANLTVERTELFTGMLVFDGVTVFMRSLLLLFVVLFAIFTYLSGIPDREDAADVYTLVLGATLGLCLMVSANHLLMVFMAVEMASVPSYVLAGLMKQQRLGSEAALKFSVYGAGAAGVMLYGISLLAGLLDSAHLPTMALRLSEQFAFMAASEKTLLALGGLLLGVGLAFKLSAVPFHFWCPDVFEGATAEVNAFLSVASKAAAMALLLRVALGLSALAPPALEPGHANRQLAVAEEGELTEPPVTQVSTAGAAVVGDNTQLEPVRDFAAKLIALLAAITCTFGNLAAYGQTNIKRLLAYSTIAHAGYMMMAVPPVLAMAAVDPTGAQRAVAALAIYISVYLFMNLGAFTVVALLRDRLGSEEISDYGGLIRSCPGAVICLSLILFGLVGLPPLSGFIGKFAVFAALVDGYQATDHSYLIALLVVGGLNTALSLFYYLRVVKTMTMDEEPERAQPVALSMLSPAGIFLFVISLPTVFLFLSWQGLSTRAMAAAHQLFIEAPAELPQDQPPDAPAGGQGAS